MLEHVIGFTPKGSVSAEGFDPRSLRQPIITDLLIDSKSHEPKSKGLFPRPVPLADKHPFRPSVRDSAIRSVWLHPLVIWAYLLLLFAFLISATTAALTAVCGDVTGGNSKTATYRRA